MSGSAKVWLSQWECNGDLPLCYWTSVTPSGLFSSVWNYPTGSLVTGTVAEAKLRATKLLRAWCLADPPRALLQTKLWSLRVSTGEPQWHWRGMHRSTVKPTATLTASSSYFSALMLFVGWLKRYPCTAITIPTNLLLWIGLTWSNPGKQKAECDYCQYYCWIIVKLPSL